MGVELYKLAEKKIAKLKAERKRSKTHYEDLKRRFKICSDEGMSRREQCRELAEQLRDFDIRISNLNSIAKNRLDQIHELTTELERNFDIAFAAFELLSQKGRRELAKQYPDFVESAIEIEAVE